MDTTFENSKASKDEWLTPPYLLKALGEFDLDPCAPVVRPWDIAKKHYTIEDNGFMRNWDGRVWCNPPYSGNTKHWLDKCAQHGNCIALTFARTETAMFFESVWSKAFALLFIRGRIQFYSVSGQKGGSAGAPSVLIAYDLYNATILKECGIPGKYISLKQ